LASPPAGGGGTGNIHNQDNSSSGSQDNSNSNSGHGGGATLGHAPAGTGLAGLLTAAAGPGERYAGLDDAGLAGAVRRWADEESWCHGRMLAAVREMIRRRPLAGHEARTPDGMPSSWQATLADEIALVLRSGQGSADKLAALAWALEVRLPLAGAALDAGILNPSLARMIADETSVLSDADARAAEAAVAGWWAGKTWPQIRKKLAAAVINIDPDGAEKRREESTRQAQVRMWQDRTGTSGLSATGLPTDRALMADRAVQARARAYKRWGIPEPMHLLRVRAFLDLLTQTDSRADFEKTTPGSTGPDSDRQDGDTSDSDRQDGDTQHGDTPDSGRQDADSADSGCQDADSAGDQDCAGGADSGRSQDGWDEDDGTDDGEDGDEDGGGSGPDDGDGDGPAGPGPSSLGLPANLDLTIPLADLLGLARRAGEARNLGTIDPGTARDLALAAARDPRTRIGIIITDPEGHAVGYARARKRRTGAAPPPGPGPQDTLWPEHSETRPDNPAVTFALAGPPPVGGYGDRAGYGTWILRIGDLELTLIIDPVPGGDCDHRYETKGYRPSARLRRLVQIRDGECVMPVCSRHPKGTDFEHAIPWPAGPTCTCNGGCRCRHDHLVKQAKGWSVQQLPGGIHQWTTPSGLTYRKGPREYPI
jgi:hypothetical protein